MVISGLVLRRSEAQGLPLLARGAVVLDVNRIVAKHPGPDNDREIDWV